MKKINLLLLFIFFLCFNPESKAQVAVNLFPSPSHQFHIDNLWQTTIINASASTINAVIQFRITDAAQANILTISTQMISLYSGLNRLSTSEGLNAKWIYGTNRAASVLQQTGKLPYGAYTFCVTVSIMGTDKPLASDCEQRNSKPMSPPLLSNPYNKDTIDTKYPVLAWIPPRPIEQGMIVNYTLRLVELQQNQSPNRALLQNPPFLNRTELTTTTLNYPADAPPLEEGHTYAWQIAAGYQGTNLGETDIWTFTVRPPKEKNNAIIYPVAVKKNDSRYYITHGVFRLAFTNNANDSKLSYSIAYINDKSFNTIRSLPEVPLKHGLNKINIDLKRGVGLKKDTYYYLKITDSRHRVYKLTYYYTGETDQ